MKRNVPIIGLVIGILLPLVGVAIMYFAWFHGRPVADFTRTLLADHQTAAKVLSLSLLMNIIPFIYFINRRLDLTARGVFIATVLYAVVIILLKFVW